MIAKVGERIEFMRGENELKGIVLYVYERSVCVELDEESAALAKVARTVVNHRKYALKKYEPQRAKSIQPPKGDYANV